MAEKANDEIMQMLNDRSGDSRKSRNRLNRRSQLGSNRIRAGLSQIRDPGGRRAKCSHLWQPWNIGRTIAGFHCTVPDFANPLAASSGFYCFFPHSATLSRFRTGSPQQPPLTLKPLRQAVIEAAVLWNHPLATTFFAAIRPYTDLEPRCNRGAAFSCNLCPRACSPK